MIGRNKYVKVIQEKLYAEDKERIFSAVFTVCGTLYIN